MEDKFLHEVLGISKEKADETKKYCIYLIEESLDKNGELNRSYVIASIMAKKWKEVEKLYATCLFFSLFERSRGMSVLTNRNGEKGEDYI